MEQNKIQERINARIAEKDSMERRKQLSINVSWAVNCAVEMVKGRSQQDDEMARGIEGWTNYFLDLYDKKMIERVMERDKASNEKPNTVDKKKAKDQATHTAELEAEI